MRPLLLVLVLMALWGCKKNKLDQWPADEISLPQTVRINDLHILSDGSVIAVGGKRGKEGWLFRSNPDAGSWSATKISDRSSLYCVQMANDSIGWIGGDTLQVWRTLDGIQWDYYWLGNQVPMHVSDRPAVRHIAMLNEETICFAAGDLYYRGVSYLSNNAGQDWDFVVADNALYQAAFVYTKPFTFGYGTAMKHESSHWRTFDVPATNCTAVAITPDNGVFVAGSDGPIYRCEEPEGAWAKIDVSHSRNTMWLSGAQLDNNVVFGGAEGELAISRDSGRTWRAIVLSGVPPIYCIGLSGSHIFAGSDNGKIYRLSWP